MIHITFDIISCKFSNYPSKSSHNDISSCYSHCVFQPKVMSQVSPASSMPPATMSRSSEEEEPEIDVISSSDESEPIFVPREKEPVVIRGVGNITV